MKNLRIHFLTSPTTIFCRTYVVLFGFYSTGFPRFLEVRFTPFRFYDYYLFSSTKRNLKKIFTFTKEKKTFSVCFWPEIEVVQELNMKHLGEIFATTVNAVMIAEKYDLIFKGQLGSGQVCLMLRAPTENCMIGEMCEAN